MAIGIVSPYSLVRLPVVALAALLGAFVGQLIAANWGFYPTYGDYEPIGATFGALALVVVVRRMTA